MGEKGSRTRARIREKTIPLFAEKGYSSITMKDVCEACHLSRGGLYRHYGSVREIFEEILNGFPDRDQETIHEGIRRNVPARKLLEEILGRMGQEMMTPEGSLSRAIYEYANDCGKAEAVRLSQEARQRWRRLLEYGMQDGGFHNVDPEQMTDLILFVYQGIRMWNGILPMDNEMVSRVIDKIRKDLVKEDETV